MDNLKTEILYTKLDGWKPSAHGVIDGRTVSYNGEYRPTLKEAQARLVDALNVYNLLDKVS